MNFLMALSRLDPEDKERCFQEIVSTLQKSGEGLRLKRDLLMEGVWNKIIDDTASNNKALVPIEATSHREKFKKKVKIALHDYSLPFTYPPPPLATNK